MFGHRNFDAYRAVVTMPHQICDGVRFGNGADIILVSGPANTVKERTWTMVMLEEFSG